jgi:KDO2-lipid IV(A) lauroyltransferase
MITLFKFLSLLPLWMAHTTGWVLGWLVFCASGVYRTRFLANARQAGIGWRQWLGAVGASGKLVAELPRLWLGAPTPYEWENEACIDKAYAAGKGIVYLTPHLGCFEITSQGVAERYREQYGSLMCLYRPARQAWLAQVMATSRQRPGLRMVPTTLSGVRQMIRALRDGQAVGLLPDQVPPEGLGQWAPFFGRPAYTMTLAARLVQQTGAAVLLVWGERLSWGRGYRLHFRELGHALSPELDLAVIQINQAMEQLIAECPQQYLWGYARYKQPRVDA